MRFICHDCGYEIPGDMDFCPRCGCMKGSATPVDDNGMPTGTCPTCGADIEPGAAYCRSCGAKAPETVSYPPRATSKGMAALMLALIPGIFNIFGLGHFVLGRWSRGAMFLAISVILLYMNGWQLFTTNVVMYLVSLAVYFYQALDIFRYVYGIGGK